jgi:hypothetical protein
LQLSQRATIRAKAQSEESSMHRSSVSFRCLRGKLIQYVFTESDHRMSG